MRNLYWANLHRELSNHEMKLKQLVESLAILFLAVKHFWQYLCNGIIGGFYHYVIVGLLSSLFSRAFTVFFGDFHWSWCMLIWSPLTINFISDNLCHDLIIEFTVWAFEQTSFSSLPILDILFLKRSTFRIFFSVSSTRFSSYTFLKTPLP